MVYHYVLDRLAGRDGLARGRKITPRTLRLFEHTNRVFGAELAREDDDLQDVCEAADGGEACQVLAEWDGKSDITSVGTHIFQEFWSRVPADPWEVDFDPAHPVSTPRNLDEKNTDVINAMKDALAYLQQRGIAFDAPWGSLQVAGDDGAPLIPIGGGEGFAGNANAVSSRLPGSHLGKYSPVSYGSSHIQAIVFRDHGVQASTILTYSQASDPTSRWSADQTRLFSKEEWVPFRFTPRQIRRHQVTSKVVSAPR
jgi:acyl-homoserine-lactone acylase